MREEERRKDEWVRDAQESEKEMEKEGKRRRKKERREEKKERKGKKRRKKGRREDDRPCCRRLGVAGDGRKWPEADGQSPKPKQWWCKCSSKGKNGVLQKGFRRALSNEL